MKSNSKTEFYVSVLRLSIWIIIIVGVIIPTVYMVERWTDSAFRDSAMGNLFATMIGAVVGILTALEINRVQQKTLKSRENKIREQNEQDHKVKILNLVKKEIEFNRESLTRRQPPVKGKLQEESCCTI